MINIDQLTEKQITELLTSDINQTSDLPEQNHDKEHQNKKYRKASVLIPFVKENNQWHIVFIRRADSDKDRHSGQVAFVGGKKEYSDESDFDTGISPSDVSILGQLGYHYSISGFQITPVVATIPWPYQLTLDAAEVSRVFTVPLTWLANEDNYEIRHRKLLWGATARMMLSLLNLAKR